MQPLQNTWSIRTKKRGRKRWRNAPGLLEAILVQGRSLKSLTPRTGLTQQAMGHRWRQAMRRFVLGTRVLRLPTGPLVLLLDGLFFPLSRKRLGLVCDGGQAVPAKSSRLSRSCAPAREKHAGLVSSIHNHSRLHTQTHPGLGLRRDFRNYQARHKPGLDRAALPFPSHQPIAAMPGPTQSQIPWQTPARSALPTCPPSSRAAQWRPVQAVLKKLRHLVRQAKGLRVMRMIVREFLRRIDHFRAYRKYPKLNLPTTTGSVEAMNRRVRDLMRQTRSVRSPQALQLWATALIRMRPAITCNGKNFQQKKFV